jgi:hypothetical protein
MPPGLALAKVLFTRIFVTEFFILMVRQSVLFVLFFSLVVVSYAQVTNDIQIGGNFDMMKTDNDRFLGKGQFGLEGNYFITPKFTATAGFDIWTDEEFNVVIGGRWYPVEEAFVRFRGLIGENDLSLGAGWIMPINRNWRFEAIGDFYFSIDFAIRAGVAYTIHRKQY